MSKPFFYRITAADLLNFATDPDGEGMSLLRFAKELQRGESDIEFIQLVIDEAHSYIDKKKQAGSKGGKARASSAKASLGSGEAEVSTPQARSSNSNRSNTETITELKPKHLSGKPDAYTEDFITFWAAYPKKTGKGAAFTAWKKNKAADHLNAIISTLSWQRPSNQWQDGFIPLPTTYLNQRRWEDEPTETTGSMTPTQPSGRYREDDV